MESSTLYLPAPYRMDYLQRSGNDTLVVLLHGYGQSAQAIYQLVGSVIPPQFSVLVPNGPFPLPGKARTVSSLGFAWYFYDSDSDKFFVPYSVPAQLVSDLLVRLQWQHKRIIIVGYSQGGYLAPFVAQELDQVAHVVCINASFRHELMNDKKFLVHAINGADDEIVDPVQAKLRHKQLEKLGRKGDFHLVEQANHRIDSAINQTLAAYLV